MFVCVRVHVCVCYARIHVGLCGGLCDYVWMLGVCLNLVFLETIE